MLVVGDLEGEGKTEETMLAIGNSNGGQEIGELEPIIRDLGGREKQSSQSQTQEI